MFKTKIQDIINTLSDHLDGKRPSLFLIQRGINPKLRLFLIYRDPINSQLLLVFGSYRVHQKVSISDMELMRTPPGELMDRYCPIDNRLMEILFDE